MQKIRNQGIKKDFFYIKSNSLFCSVVNGYERIWGACRLCNYYFQVWLLYEDSVSEVGKQTFF
jgi:hypothetical protein